jgi:signal peptidase I
MLPTLEVGDFILVNKFTYGVRIPVINTKITDGNAPQRGDVMVFRYPVDPRKDYIKRIVAVGGDRIEYRDKRLTINGVAAPLKQLDSETKIAENLGMRRFDAFQEKLGDKEHRIYTVAEFPTVNLGGVKRFPNLENCAYNNEGVVCTVPPGHFFMMGDNRDNSEDSRYWGFVPDKNIVGKAVAIWMNFGSWKRVFTRIE